MSHRARESATGGDIRGAVPDIAALIRATGFLAEMKRRIRMEPPISRYAIALLQAERG
jgi:hypothetical protein